MRLFRLLGSLLVLGALTVPGVARADNEYDITCDYTGTVTFSPGLTFDVSKGKVETTGTAVCSGVFRGEAFAGAPATFASNGHYTGSCAGVSGRAHNKVRTVIEGREFVANGHGEFHSAGPGGAIAFTGKAEGNATYTGTAVSFLSPPPPDQACTPTAPARTFTQFGSVHTVDPS